jgi:hypothetical protein
MKMTKVSTLTGGSSGCAYSQEEESVEKKAKKIKPIVLKKDLHKCKLPKGAKYGMWGGAVGECWGKEDGTLWVDNDEYASQVNYCPFCGFKAITMIDPKNKNFKED